MRKALARNPERVLLLIAGYVLLAAIVRIVRSSALEYDEAQQAIFSQYVLWGYGAQPPLYSWLQYGLNALIGSSIASLTLLKNGLLFTCCLIFCLAARLVLRDRSLVKIATLGVLTLPPVFVMSQRDLTHTVLALVTVSLFAFALFRTLKTPTAAGYLLTGIAIGLGALAKYNCVLIPLAAIIAIALDRDLRPRLFDWRMLLTIGAAAAIALPHGLWVLDNIGIATAQTTGEMLEGSEHIAYHGLDGTLDLLSAFLKGIALTTAVFAVLYFRDIKAIIRASDASTRLVGRIILFSLLMVLVIIWGLGVVNIRQKWLSVYLLLWPLYLALKVQAAALGGDKTLKPMLIMTSVLAFGFLAVLLGRGVLAPQFERYSIVHIPFDRFAEALKREELRQPDYVIAPGDLVGGNLKIQFPNATVLSGDKAVETIPSPWPEGTVVLLAGTTQDGKLPDDIGATLSELARRASLPAPDDIRQMEVPYGGSGSRRHAFYYTVETVGGE